MIRFRDVPEGIIDQISDGCGIVARGLSVPNFIFKARCDQHDFYTLRGTGWSWNSHWFLPYSVIRWYLQGEWYLQKANTQFYYYMMKDAMGSRNQVLEKIIYALLATIYFVAVTAWALIPRVRSMTEWRTIEEIISYAEELND